MRSGNIDKLLDAAAFPHAVEKLELIETHISWIILTGEFAYKIKKPVNLGFVDFTSLARRKHFCEEELRLNQRTAPDLYLDVVPIAETAEGFRIGLEPAIEFADSSPYRNYYEGDLLPRYEDPSGHAAGVQVLFSECESSQHSFRGGYQRH